MHYTTCMQQAHTKYDSRPSGSGDSVARVAPLPQSHISPAPSQKSLQPPSISACSRQLSTPHHFSTTIHLIDKTSHILQDG
jgi:hypothetical protein